MAVCSQCKARIEEGSEFCPDCGATVERAAPDISPRQGFVGRVEQNVYFKIARDYAWLIVFGSVLGLGISIFLLAPAALDLWSGGDTKVSPDDIRAAMAAREQPRGRAQPIEERIDPARLASLDRAIYEIIELLPREQQQSGPFGRVAIVKLEIENLRSFIKERVRNLPSIDDQIAALHELKSAIVVFPETERFTAIDKFFEVKAAKNMAIESKKATAATKLQTGVLAILSAISIITLGSMILVLLAVERNTRPA
jgi:hypothetical protein